MASLKWSALLSAELGFALVDLCCVVAALCCAAASCPDFSGAARCILVGLAEAAELRRLGFAVPAGREGQPETP